MTNIEFQRDGVSFNFQGTTNWMVLAKKKLLSPRTCRHEVSLNEKNGKNRQKLPFPTIA